MASKCDIHFDGGEKAPKFARQKSSVQGSTKRWALGCVNIASWLPLAAGRENTQPRANLIKPSL